MTTGRSGIAGKMAGDLLKVKIVAGGKLHRVLLLGCLALWLAGCAPKIYETPYVPPPPPPQPAPPPAVSRPVFYVAATRLNLRGCAGMDCPKISMLEQNEVVEKLGEMDDWYEVIIKRDGRRGWVSSRHLSPEPVTPAPEAPPLPTVTPPPPPEAAPAPPPVEKPTPAKAPVEKPAPVKPPAAEKPKPAKPGEIPPAPRKKPEETRPAKPTEPAPKPAPATEKPAPPKEKPAPPEKPAPIKEPEPEQPKKIRIM